MIGPLLQFAGWTALNAALIFLPAGTLAYPAGWAFMVLFVVGGLAMTLWLAKYSPALLRERMSFPVQRGQKPWDRIWAPIFVLGFFGWTAVMGWDAARAGFTAVPVWLQVVGGLAVVVAMLGSWWTFRENAFAIPVVKIQEGQRVIDTGPYAIVRHPLYTSALFYLFGLPLLLGSWLGLLLSVAGIVGIAWRAVHEEQVLRAELDGYEAYMARMPYRFVPYVW